VADLLGHYHLALPVPRDLVAAGFAVVVILYFWWRNTQGMHESSSDALRIMQITTVMVVILFAWSFVTLLLRQGAPLPPVPSVETLRFSDEALGWLKHTRFPAFTAIALLIGFGHSFLAMSGYESLAQVYREIESPKAKNLQRAALVVFVYSVLFTGAVSFLATAFIPDAVRPQFYDNLISGIVMHLSGPLVLRLGFQVFVVVVGFLILASAVNTAIVGSNAVLNRVSEDGVLPEWFRQPHRKYGTTYRFLNLVVALQLVTVVLSGGHIYVLGEAYAFGVVWSFALKALAVLVLRYRAPGPREWRVPGNLRIGGRELPIGLAAITLSLLTVAVVNLFTKQVATISGSIFTIVIYATFVVSERATHRRRAAEAGRHTLDQFHLLPADDVGLQEVSVRPGCVLVPVRDPNTLAHLKWALDRTDTAKQDIVVMTVRLIKGPDAGFTGLSSERVFRDYEQGLFTRVVSVAEREGRPVKLLVVPSSQVADAIAQAAVSLQASDIVIGESATMTGAQMAHRLGEAWDRLGVKSRHVRSRLVAYRLTGEYETFLLGPHAPPLSEDDLELIHRLWLDAVGRFGLEVHHRDVVRAALEDLERTLLGARRDEALALIAEQVRRSRAAESGQAARGA